MPMIIQRRPLRARSRAGPMSGRHDGERRHREQEVERAPCPRASSGGTSKKSEPARAVATMASPAVDERVGAGQPGERRWRRTRPAPTRRAAAGGPAAARRAPYDSGHGPVPPGIRQSARSHGADRGAGSRDLVLVAEAADGDDAGRVGRVVLDLGPQPLDVDVEGLGVARRSRGPRPGRSACRGCSTRPALLEQQREQLELLERQAHLARPGSPPRGARGRGATSPTSSTSPLAGGRRGVARAPAAARPACGPPARAAGTAW